MKAIPTKYGNTLFRSRLEAKWAMFFDFLKVRWLYEPEGYTQGPICYLPDFWLPEVYSRRKGQGLFFEVKPIYPYKEEVDKAEMLAMGSHKTVIVTVQSPEEDGFERLLEFADYEIDPGAGFPDKFVCESDDGLRFGLCESCGSARVDYYSRNEPTCPCGQGRFSSSHLGLNRARELFPLFSRWEGRRKAA